MTTSAIPADSTSYPTLAVIIAHDIQDGETKTAIWMLSWAIYRFLYLERGQTNPADHPPVTAKLDELYGHLHREAEAADAVDPDMPEFGPGGAAMRRSGVIFDHLVVNHRRSIETFTREHRERMEALSA